MGLDSVQYIVSVEKYFSIQFDNEAIEKVGNISDLVDLLSKILGIKIHDNSLITQIQLQLKPWIDLADNDFVFNQNNINDKVFWDQLEKATQLTCPIPFMQRNISSNIFDKIAHYLAPQTTYDFKTITFKHYCEVVCIANYQKLIPAETIQNQFELYIVVAGLLSEQMGIDPFEINPQKTFADDYGMD